jgi:nitrate reductase delta subunit
MHAAEALKLISRLLQYPDRRFLGQLCELETVLDTLPPGRLKKGLKTFLAQMRSDPALRLQERYTAAFDLNPSTTLNMTYHRWGDSEKRAAALTRLQQIYLDAGYETATRELPDYLPLMLEFMAVCPETRGHDTLRECLAGLDALVEKLRATAPRYAELLQLLGGETGIPHPALAVPAVENDAAPRGKPRRA